MAVSRLQNSQRPVRDQVSAEEWDTHAGFKNGVRRRFGVIEWPALLRKLDRTDPSYRN